MSGLTRHEQVATFVLEYGRSIAPGMFPGTSDQMKIQSWGDVLGEIVIPDGLWQEGVKKWVKRQAGLRDGDRHMATAYDILLATKEARADYERTPEGREVMRRWRERRQDIRDAKIKAGTMVPMQGTSMGRRAKALGAPAGAIEERKQIDPQRLQLMLDGAFKREEGVE